MCTVVVFITLYQNLKDVGVSVVQLCGIFLHQEVAILGKTLTPLLYVGRFVLGICSSGSYAIFFQAIRASQL